MVIFKSVFILILILINLGCSSNNNINRGGVLAAFNNEANFIFNKNKLNYESELASLNNSFIIFSIEAADLSIEEYESVLKNKLEKRGWIQYKTFNDTDIFCDESRRNSINIVRPAQYPTPLKESLGAVQDYGKWNIVFLNSSRVTIYCN